CTPATVPLSVAVALTVIVPATVAPELGAVMETAGGVVSLKTVTVTAAVVAWLPAADRTSVVKGRGAVVGVVVFNGTAYGAAVASPPRLRPSRLNCTPATVPLSVAFALTVIVPATVAPALGAVMETAGGVVSLKTVTVTAAVVAWLPA